MDDRQFTDLDPPAAQAALRNIVDEQERTRLLQLYARTRGFLVNGTGWTNPAAVPLKDAWGRRTNRAIYWLLIGIVGLLYTGVSIIFHAKLSVSEVVLILIAIPRLHDIGRSGWLTLVPITIEIVGMVAALPLPLETAKTVMGVLVLTIGALMIWVGVIPGQLSSNRFGEPPPPGLQGWRQPKAPSKVADTFD